MPPRRGGRKCMAEGWTVAGRCQRRRRPRRDAGCCGADRVCCAPALITLARPDGEAMRACSREENRSSSGPAWHRARHRLSRAASGDLSAGTRLAAERELRHAGNANCCPRPVASADPGAEGKPGSAAGSPQARQGLQSYRAPRSNGRRRRPHGGTGSPDNRAARLAAPCPGLRRASRRRVSRDSGCSLRYVLTFHTAPSHPT
jgi:hypothetical protein